MSRYDDFRALTCTADDAVLTVELHRPEHGNAVDGLMHREFTEIFHRIRNDHDVRAVVLTGAGDFFCNGPDVDWYLGFDEAEHTRVMREARWIVQDLLAVGQPVVVAMNGDAMGFGSSLVTLADLVVVADDAVLGDHHVPMGITAGDGGAMTLPFTLGLTRAREMLLLQRELTGKELVEHGFATRAVPRGEVLAVAKDIARQLADQPPGPLQATKAALNRQVQFALLMSGDGALANSGWDYHLPAAAKVRDQLRADRP